MYNNNNNNNNRFLYSAFPNYDQSASQCIITPVIGFRHNSALRVHFLHSLGSIPASRRFTGAHNANSTTITFASYRVPIYTPGWRAAMWIKGLAEGQKVPGIDGNRTRNPLIQSQGFNPIYHGTFTIIYYNTGNHVFRLEYMAVRNYSLPSHHNGMGKMTPYIHHDKPIDLSSSMISLYTFPFAGVLE